ncbi:MAG: TonB-dependent siderophore receptor [Acinetobacter sp.]|nr:TonB-dependent siderophore receptor [Acinetobacter sp.]
MRFFKLNAINVAVLSVLSVSAYAETTKPATPSQVLPTIEVVADRQGSKVQTNIVTLEERNESTDTDLRSLLEKEPSIEFGGGNGTSQFLTIRGMGQNSVDIKIDGASSDSQILYHQGRQIIDPALVKSVSVQKGAGSASAGIGATNGAVIVKTVDALDLLEGSDRDYGFRVSGGYASNDGHSYGASVFGKAGNFDALLSYHKNNEDNYRPGKGYANGLDRGDYLPYTAMDKENYIAKLGATFGDHRIVLSHLNDAQKGYRYIREEFAVDNFTTGSRLTTARQYPTYREISLSNTNLEYTASNLGFINKLNANAFYMQNKRESADDSVCGYCGNVAGPTKTVIDTKGANINFDSEVGENTLLKYGVNYRHQEIKPGVISDNSYVTNPEKTDTGAYVELIGNVDKFTLTTGLRYDHFDVTVRDGATAKAGEINPSVGVIFQATPELSFSANHYYATRSPRLYDALMVGLARGRVSIDSNIKPEQARNSEIGFNYNNGALSIDGSYFWQTVEDVIVNPQDRHNTGWSKTVNGGYSKNKGYELNIAYRAHGVTARAGVADSKPRFYLDPQWNRTTNAYEPVTALLPEFAVQTGRTWTAGLSYRFDNPNLEIGWKGRYVEATTENALVTGPATNHPEYTLHDFYANWKAVKNLNVNFAVNNAFNKLYYPHAQRGVNLEGVGRDIRVGFNYTF